MLKSSKEKNIPFQHFCLLIVEQDTLHNMTKLHILFLILIAVFEKYNFKSSETILLTSFKLIEALLNGKRKKKGGMSNVWKKIPFNSFKV
jgi:hypothetical protein